MSSELTAMVNTTNLPTGATPASDKIAAAATAKKPRAKASHPRTADMVNAAIKALEERGGSSLQAIKKYIAGTYNVDAEKVAPFIKRYLKSSVIAKKLVQTKGKGASGSFKLSLAEKASSKKSPVKKVAAMKKSTSAKKPVAKKSADSSKVVKKVLKKKPVASPKKKVMKTLAAKPPKPKVTKAIKPAKKTAKVAIKKPTTKTIKSTVKKAAVKK